MKSIEEVLAGKKIFLTGHTGFTGSWASIWLESIGAEVFGYSLAPESSPNLYTEANVGALVSGIEADIRDFETLRQAIAEFEPDLVLHLAAQPLVRRSYGIPRETFEINAQGTANVLEAARNVKSIKGILCVTTDKVYKNHDIDHKYRESDELGGKDPYSASKAAAELIISSFRESFPPQSPQTFQIAVARGGNIIGGGDWSEDRLVPDFVKAFETGKPVKIRFPSATRPWQHVLALVEGYLKIMSGLLGSDSVQYAQAFNLGPLEEESISVEDVLDKLGKHLPGVEVIEEESKIGEAQKLDLDSTLASSTFGWKPAWPTDEAIQKTAEWYKSKWLGEKTAYELCLEQIHSWLASKNENSGSKS